MNIIIDLDLQQAVQGFGSRQAALPYQVKSQDTPTVAVYFVRGNVTYDLGSSPGLRFGVFVAGNPNALVQQNTFTRTTDNLARTVYVAYPNFNTTQMLAAIGSQPQLSAIGEIRYQTTHGTIARTADIDFTVVRTLLSETVMDNLIAAFVTPAVNANVTARINNTGWLSAGLNISIAAGAGAYQVVSVTNATDFVAKNLGGASNAASGTTIPSGTAVGIAPVNVLQAYPDPSIIEVTTRKDIINGYAGLDGTGLLKGTEMPVDGTTIAVSGGKLTVVGGGGGAAGNNAYTTTSASFVVPAVGATVSVAVLATAWMGGTGFYVFITGAGYYTVSSITDATHAVLTNAGGTSNALVGTTVPSGATVTPGGPAGQAGAAGTPGAALSAYDALSASFIMPAPAANVTITIANTAWIAPTQIIYIQSAGYFQVASISNATQALVTNLLYPGNASAGATIASGSKVSPGGLQGPQGAGGPGLNAFTTLSANFTQPAINATVTVNVGTTAWMAAGQGIFIQGGGYYTISSIADLTHAVVTNLGGTSNIGAGSIVTGSGTQNVTPAGTPGLAGISAYTTTSASFNMPTSGATVTVTVGATAWMAQGQILYLPAAGYFSVSSITDATHAVLTNLGYTGNATAGTVIASGSAVVASGVQGPAGTGGGGGGTLTDATTAVGYSWISNPAGILKRIVAGSSALSISDSGSVLTVDAPGAGGGGGLIARTTAIELFDDFVGMVSAPTTNAQPALGWMTITSGGAGGSLANLSPPSATPEIGLWQFNAPTSGVGVYILSLTNNPGSIIAAPAQGPLTLEWRIKMNALESGTNYADHRFGFANNPANTPWIGCYFQYIANSFANWQCVGYNGSTAVSSDSGVAVSTSFVKLTITMNAGWTTATFAINGTTVATLTSQSFGVNGWMPATTAKWGAGAPAMVQLDWFYAKYSVTR